MAESYRQKWGEFLRSIEGPGPLGVAHERPSNAPMRRDDPIAHNIVLSLAHVLAAAAGQQVEAQRARLGRSTGHYHELARRLTQLEFDWHVRELTAVCEVGAELSPDIPFTDSDDCLERDYDLVSPAAPFSTRGLARELAKLAPSPKPWLFLTGSRRWRPFRRTPRYSARYAYGYETEYVGWVFHRGELVLAAEELGLELVREYALVDPITVAGAPENPRHIGLLLRSQG